MKVNQKNKTRIGISLLCAIILLTGCHITPNKKQDGEEKEVSKACCRIFRCIWRR